MRSVIHVMSDLHLGGAPASATSAGFQICPPANQVALAGLIDRLPASRADVESRLVIAGDIVDFLAEAPFSAFTPEPPAAMSKLASIFGSTRVVWDALARFVGERDGVLDLMIGNHDLELSLPEVRQMLARRIGPGRVSFIYDNEALALGPVLIEHGNRFDAWNAVPHGALRRVRSQLSRRLPVVPEFPSLPGSRLVVDVMNPLKAEHPFIDLLKPETAAVLPVLAALGAVGVRDAWKFFRQFRRQWAIDYDEDREPRDETYIRADADADQSFFDLAEELAARAGSARVDALLRAWAALRGRLLDAFAVDKEDETYLAPARRSAAAGFQVVVYGHTHLAKRIPLGPDGAALPVYLNTGTWADLMCVPLEAAAASAPPGADPLRSFVEDLERGRLEPWRRAVPTYARIRLEDDIVTSAEVLFADDDEPLTTAAMRRRLA